MKANALALVPWLAVTAIVLALSWLGPALDAAPYGSGAPADTHTDAIERSLAADLRECQELHGPHAVAVHLPDGQHRCADKHGRKLSRRSVITIAHEARP